MHLVQALPENKLASLLMQHKFNEAEAFATEYGMDPEVKLRRVVSLDHPLAYLVRRVHNTTCMQSNAEI